MPHAFAELQNKLIAFRMARAQLLRSAPRFQRSVPAIQCSRARKLCMFAWACTYTRGLPMQVSLDDIAMDKESIDLKRAKKIYDEYGCAHTRTHSYARGHARMQATIIAMTCTRSVMHARTATQRYATLRNATQRYATQRCATQRNATNRRVDGRREYKRQDART